LQPGSRCWRLRWRSARVGWSGAAQCRYRAFFAPEALHSFVEQSLVGIYFVADGQIVYGNQAMADILGYSRQALGSLDINRIIHQDDIELVRSNLQRRFSGELASLQYGFRIVRGDGAVRQVEVHSHRAMVDGKPMVVGVMLDTTELANTQADLALYAKVFEASSEGIVVTDAEGRVLTANPAVLSRTGFSRDELIGESLYEMEARTGNRAYADATAKAIKRGYWQDEIGALRKDGGRYPARMTVDAVRDATGKAIQYVTVLSDLSDVKRAERQSRLAATVFDNASEGILITDGENRIIAVNPAFTRITGYGADEAIGKLSRMLMGDGPHAIEPRDIWAVLHRDGHWQGEMRDRRKGGEWYPVWMSISAVRDERGHISNYVGVFTDYTSRKETEDRLHFLANHDGLTGLLNRSSVMSRLSDAIRRADTGGTRFALLFLDLDRFKAVNDTLGHGAGDQLLRVAADRLRYHVKDKDIIARLGGDEFTILLDDIHGPEVAADVATRIVRSMSEPFVVDGHEMFVTASIGVALYPDDGGDGAALLKNADVAT
jgi:diguanylate cyclase (GGDEF)-like protein/PAS domain S-box-containing protein